MEPALEVKDLTVVFHSRHGEVKALDRLNLSVSQGQVFGFLGPNGAGKTTTMMVLLGFTEPASGKAEIFGRDCGKSIARQRIGYLPEHPDTYRFLTGRELLNMTGNLFLMEQKGLRRRVSEVLEEVELTEAADRRIATYSRGMMQRICLAQSMINDPDLLILDEPTGGLDPLGRVKIRNLISGFRDAGKAVFFSSHELSEAELVCDRLAIISRGRIAAEGRVSDMVKTEQNLEKYFMKVIGETQKQTNPPLSKGLA
ncbi:MAG: ABC transporter ATP-binding protein [Kiritimatiellia bacterium]